jgi:hypothetical protein
MKTAISIAMPLIMMASSVCLSPSQAIGGLPTPTPTPASLNYKFKIVDPPNAVETSVRGINNWEVYVGDTATAAQFAVSSENGFIAKEHFFKQFSVPAPFGAKDTDANDISNCNVVLGMYDTTTGDHGFTLDEKGFHKLPDPGDPTLTFPDWNGINKDGVIVGIVSPVPGTGNKAFVLKNGVYTYYLAPGAFATEFNGINDRCDIVGEAFFQVLPVTELGFCSAMEFSILSPFQEHGIPLRLISTTMVTLLGPIRMTSRSGIMGLS